MKFNQPIPTDLSLEQLISSLKAQNKGLAFENDHTNIRPLSCLVEGTAGQMLFWATLYQQTNTQIFKDIVYALHNYQKTTWQKTIKNWGDFSKHITDIETHWEHIENFRAGNFSFFTEPSDNLSFWTGTAGIIYTYKKLFEIFGDADFQNETNKGLKKLKAKNETYAERQTPFDNLKFDDDFLSKAKVFSQENFIEIFIKTLFPKSFTFYINQPKTDVSMPLNFEIRAINKRNIFKYAHNFLMNEANRIDDKNLKSMFIDIIRHEKKKGDLLNMQGNKALIRAEELVEIHNIEAILKLDNRDLLSKVFVINERLSLSVTKFAWEFFKGASLPKKVQKNILLLKTSKEILEVEIMNIELVLLQQFINPISIQEAIKNYIELLGTNQNEVNQENIQKNTFEIIRKLIFGRFIQVFE